MANRCGSRTTAAGISVSDRKQSLPRSSMGGVEHEFNGAADAGGAGYGSGGAGWVLSARQGLHRYTRAVQSVQRIPAHSLHPVAAGTSRAPQGIVRYTGAGNSGREVRARRDLEEGLRQVPPGRLASTQAMI